MPLTIESSVESGSVRLPPPIRWDNCAQAFRWATRQQRPLLFRGETSDAPRAARTWWRRWLRDALLRRLYRRCAVCLYLGTQSKAHYTRLGVPEQRLIRSPYCVDASGFETDEPARERLRPATRARLGLTESDWVVLFSGKLSWRKGVDLLPTALVGGDDYELVLTFPPDRLAGLRDAATSAGTVLTVIGKVVEGEGVGLPAGLGDSASGLLTRHGFEHSF
jgi:hypothetical protein